MLRRNLAVELFDSRLLFWIEPHVLIWRSLICSVHTRLCSGILGGAGRCRPSGPEPAQQPPACSAFFPEGLGCRQGTGAPVVWSAPGCHLRLLSPSALPHQLQSGAVTDVSPAPEEERSRRALDLRGVCSHAGCVPHDYVPRVTWRLLIVGLARDKQLPREMDILGTLI